MEHYPVMKEKVLEFLKIKEGGIYIDATAGYGGHTRFILENSKNIFVYCIDKDENAIENLKENLADFSNFKAIKSGFENLKEVMEKEKIKEVDGILFDLGFSIHQVKNAERGFSFSMDGPIDMRYDRSQRLTASEILNKWSGRNLVFIFREYGEIKSPEKIVRKIIERRKRKRFESTKDFADFISSIYREKRGIHPATKFFMALRIATNNELLNLKEGLEQASELVKNGGRIVVITFHSLEDRIVKRFFKNRDDFEIITKKVIKPDYEEVRINPESRSAKLRAVEKR